MSGQYITGQAGTTPPGRPIPLGRYNWVETGSSQPGLPASTGVRSGPLQALQNRPVIIGQVVEGPGQGEAKNVHYTYTFGDTLYTNKLRLVEAMKNRVPKKVSPVEPINSNVPKLMQFNSRVAHLSDVDGVSGHLQTSVGKQMSSLPKRPEASSRSSSSLKDVPDLRPGDSHQPSGNRWRIKVSGVYILPEKKTT